VDDFDHHLLRFHSIEHILPQCFLFDRFGKLLGCFVVYVGIQQGTTHFLECLGNIDLGNLSLPFQYLKRPLQSVT